MSVTYWQMPPAPLMYIAFEGPLTDNMKHVQQFLEGHGFGIRACTVQTGYAEPMEVELSMIALGTSGERQIQRNKAFAIEEAPEDAREAMAALFELDQAAPPGKMAVADVCEGREDGRRFVVRLVDRPT